MADRTLELLIRLAGNNAGLKAAIAGSQRDLAQLGRGGAQAGGDVSRGIDGAVASIRRLAIQAGAGFLTFQGLRAVVGDFIRTAGDFERLRIQLKSLMGTAEQGEQAFAWLQDFAERTPFQLQDLTQSFIRLKAFGMDPMNGTMAAIADQAALLGGSQETLNGIVLALGQAWAKQKLQGEEILQLVERGVPVWELLAEVTGRTTAEVQDLSAKGALGRDVIAGLIEAMGRRSSGAAADQMSTFSGMVSNAQDAWDRFLDTIAQSGALDEVKTALDGILGSVTDAADSGELEALAQQIAGGFGTVIGAGRDVTAVIQSIAPELKALAELWVASKVLAYASALRAAAIAGPLAAGGLGLVTGALTLLSRALVALPMLILVQQLGRLAAAAIEHRDAVRGMTDAQNEFERAQRKAMAANAEAAEAGTLSARMIRTSTRAEQDAYAERLRQAEEFWQAQFELEARANPGSEAARQANVNVRRYREALAQIAPILADRQRQEQDAADRVTKLKKDETDRIVAELDRQKEAYDEANRAIEAATKQREEIEKEFQGLVDEVSRPARPDAEPTFLGASQIRLAAEQALRAGDTERAIELAREAADAVRELHAQGGGGFAIVGLAKQIQAVATAAAAQAEAAATQQAATIKATIEDLTTRAKALETLKVGFDTAAAITDAQALRAALEAELAANPITVKVKLDPEGAGAQVLADAEVTTPGRAHGGIIPGHSPTPTADNVLIRATAGEFMQPVRSVRRYGLDVMEALRSGSVDPERIQRAVRGYAQGGLISPALGAIPPVPAPPSIAATPGAPGGTPGAPLGVLVLEAGGRSYRATLPVGDAEELLRTIHHEALKAGARTPR